MQNEDQQLNLPLIAAPVPPVGERHMALDVSTLSDSADAVVASLAWVIFDPKDTGGANDTWFKTLDWDQRTRAYNWPKIQDWMTKSGLARRAIVNFTPPVPLNAAVQSVIEGFNKHHCVAVWGTRRSLNTVENAIRYCDKKVPWMPSQARDLSSCWALSVDQGTVTDLERHQTEPEDVPLGNAAFIARAVRELYAPKMDKPRDDSIIN